MLYNRLIDTYNVQMFISAGNSGAGPEHHRRPVGRHEGGQRRLVHQQGDLADELRLVDSASRQHAPVLLARSARGRRLQAADRRAGRGHLDHADVAARPARRRHVHAAAGLRDVQRHVDGLAAGGRRRGAARQRREAAGVQRQPAQLRTALISTARFIPGYGAYEQGNGLIDVGAGVGRPAAAAVDAGHHVRRSPVNTVLSGFLATPGRGVGIYDREGVTAGDSYTRTYTFTRTSGAAAPVTYKLTWVGNDGTFSLARDGVARRRTTPSRLPVTGQPSASVGIHSAVLNLDDPLTPGIEYQTLNTVVAAEAFTAADSYSQTVERHHRPQPARRASSSAVPAGTPAFKVDITAGGAASGPGQVRFLRFHPYGVGIESNSTPNCYNPPVGGCDARQPDQPDDSNPQAGVWEVVGRGPAHVGRR